MTAPVRMGKCHVGPHPQQRLAGSTRLLRLDPLQIWRQVQCGSLPDETPIKSLGARMVCSRRHLGRRRAGRLVAAQKPSALLMAGRWQAELRSSGAVDSRPPGFPAPLILPDDLP
jgi:hypothetical protein